MFRNYGYPKSEPENTTTEEGEFGENSYAAIFGRSKIECKPYKGPMPNKTIPAGLRHLKMELKSLIVAKQSCTGQEIEDSYCSLFGYRPQYREFGYKCIDELLAAFPDICKGYIDPSGSKIYIPVVDERHKDLAFQLSRAPRSPSKREHRHPCSNGPDRTSPNRQNIPPISDFRFRQPWLKNRVASTKSIGQFPLPPVPASERLIFKDDGAKCPERCRAITDMVRNIGEKSPDRTETRCHIETLKNHYYHLTGLSLWGKIMHVSDYAEAMDKPDFYKFWRIMNVPSTDGGRAHYMVVPTDPRNNYLYLYQCDTSNTSEALEGLPEAYGIEGEPDKKAETPRDVLSLLYKRILRTVPEKRHNMSQLCRKFEKLNREGQDKMFLWLCLSLLLSVASCEEEQPVQWQPMLRHQRAIAPSFSSWCLFYPERCRMLQGLDGGPMKRFRFF